MSPDRAADPFDYGYDADRLRTWPKVLFAILIAVQVVALVALFWS